MTSFNKTAVHVCHIALPASCENVGFSMLGIQGGEVEDQVPLLLLDNLHQLTFLFCRKFAYDFAYIADVL